MIMKSLKKITDEAIAKYS